MTSKVQRDPYFEIFFKLMNRIQKVNEGLIFVLQMLLESLQNYVKSIFDLRHLDYQLLEHLFLDLFHLIIDHCL